MKYTLCSSYYCDFDTICVNTLPPRSYFIPYPNKESLSGVSLADKRYKSPMVRLLNGTWDFKYYANPNDLSDNIDTSLIEFDKIDVPSCWQYRGYGFPMYLNVRYPFSYKPPIIPTTKPIGLYFSALDGFKKAPKTEMNHVGLYRTTFEVSDLSKIYEISFLGVSSCIEVHLNGQFVGYAEESHNCAEFDLTKLVKEGENELLCVVRRWCNGSYLECQDMFRNNGIFRDVLLRISDKDYIYDIDFKTIYKDGHYNAEATALVKGKLTVTFTLQGHGLLLKKQVKSNGDDAVKVCFENLDVLTWNAEEPNTYELFIETENSCICQNVGFKHIEIKGNLYLLNGKKVKFKGVNHHDTDSKNGYYLTPSQIEQDMLLCKRFNIDTVRTSHYAPDPLLMEIATKVGLYIISEVDIETHGAFAMKLPPSYNRLSNDKRWKNHYLSRVIRHYNRDKINSTAVVMFSLGNESGGIYNTDAMYSYFKSVTDIPIHYESAIYTKRKAYDVASRMYPPVSELSDIAQNKCKTKQFMDRPYFLCEYAHAMGVGPGNIEGYWKEIYNCDSLIGGCVWEMVDHAVEHEDGKITYGGDHGEWIHDGNFCCDGIFYPNRMPSTGAWIVRHAYRPIRVTHLSGNDFDIFNTTAFTEGSAYRLKIKISNGIEFDYIPKAKPLSHEKVQFDLGEIKGDVFMNIATNDKDGNSLALEQIILNESFISKDIEVENLPSWFSLEDGLPVIKIGDSKVTASDPYTILYRSQTDNDSINFVFKPMKKWYKQETHLIGYSQNETNATSEYLIKVGSKRFLCSDFYQGCKTKDGKEAVSVYSVIHPLRVRGVLPRFAKAFRFDSSFNKVDYLGRSGESYIDMKEQFPIEECSCFVSEMTEPNIKCQESGNRCDTRYVEISDGNNSVRFDAIEKSFELSVKPYSDKELINMKHREDEITTGTYVSINAFQQGIGTGSCGPYTLKEHCYKANKDYNLRFMITVDRW